MTYKSRDPAQTRAPSAGMASRPIGGLGKLDPGIWRLSVLSVNRRPLSEDLLLEAHTGHVHHERVLGWPQDWDQPGTQLEARVGAGPGFAVERDVRQFRGVDAQTRLALTDWTADIAQVYTVLTGRGLCPATTQLTEVRHGTGEWIRICLAKTSEPATPATAGAADAAAADGAALAGDAVVVGSRGGAE